MEIVFAAIGIGLLIGVGYFLWHKLVYSQNETIGQTGGADTIGLSHPDVRNGIYTDPFDGSKLHSPVPIVYKHKDFGTITTLVNRDNRIRAKEEGLLHLRKMHGLSSQETQGSTDDQCLISTSDETDPSKLIFTPSSGDESAELFFGDHSRQEPGFKPGGAVNGFGAGGVTGWWPGPDAVKDAETVVPQEQGPEETPVVADQPEEKPDESGEKPEETPEQHEEVPEQREEVTEPAVEAESTPATEPESD